MSIIQNIDTNQTNKLHHNQTKTQRNNAGIYRRDT